MNELFAADPDVCHHFNDLKLLLSSFGPYAGRYLANYPVDWTAQVESQFNTMGEIEAAKIKTLLRRARESLTLVTRTNLPWCAELGWLANAAPLLTATPAVFDGLIALQANAPTVHQLDTLDLPPTADERIAGCASEYARVAKILLVMSPEIALVDPYLNPLKRASSTVLQALFKLAAKGKCQNISIWARASVVLGIGATAASKADLEASLRQLAQQASFKPGRTIEMMLVEDETRQTKMHGRYLLSVKGGISLDQGFQQLPQGRQVDACPVGKSIHNDLLDIYFDGKHDMRVAERLAITI